MQTKELVQEITDYVNTFGDKSKEFNKSMSCEHRTLQQSFTRLCLSWIEHIASNEYLVDGRNEQSQKIAQQLLEGFKDKQIKEGYTGSSLESMSKPSCHLGCI